MTCFIACTLVASRVAGIILSPRVTFVTDGQDYLPLCPVTLTDDSVIMAIEFSQKEEYLL
jgi:hypothetical protein